MDFSAVIRAALANETIRLAPLIHFEFASQDMRLWIGHGQLKTNDGEIWLGTGELGSISGLTSPLGGTAPETSFSLSGVDPSLTAKVITATEEVKGRGVTVYWQFFDENMQNLADHFAGYYGLMDIIRIRADGPTSRIIEVTAESLFYRRATPPWAFLSHRDQQRMYLGDMGLEYVSGMTNRTIEWPDFS